MSKRVVQVLTVGEVAEQFRVHPKTILRWEKAGKFHPLRSEGGHRLFPADEVEERLRQRAGSRYGWPAGLPET